MDLTRGFEVLFSSRRLFSNWCSAGTRYILMRYGLIREGLIPVKCGNSVYLLTPRTYSAIVNNYYEKAFESLECREGLYAVVVYRGRRILFYDSFEFLHDIVHENFIGGAYDTLNVANKTVVDIGVGVGDTAILFALRGARRIIALEPYPSLYRKALVNVRINGFENRVVLVNAGLGRSNGEVCSSIEDVNGYTSFTPSPRCDVRVRMYNLRSLIRDFNIEKGSILKVDCEGCEYEAILQAPPEDLLVFHEIEIEYHNGYRELEKFLKELGYNVKVEPIKSFPQSTEKQGYIVAKKN